MKLLMVLLICKQMSKFNMPTEQDISGHGDCVVCLHKESDEVLLLSV